jgi:uncharacterized membrane protein YdjX (TVP38/TMEM64 family)
VDPRRAAVLRLALLALLLGALFAAGAIGGLRPDLEHVRDWAGGFGAAGPLVYVPLSAALSCAFVPGPVLAGAAGLLFGTWLGTPTALASATLAACAQLLVARHVAGRHVAALLPPRVRAIDAFLERRGFVAVMLVRLTPGVPYTLTNYGSGLTRLRVAHMAAGTAAGALPRTWVYVALGGSLDDLGRPEAVVALVLLVAFGAAGLWLARRQIALERGRSLP